MSLHFWRNLDERQQLLATLGLALLLRLVHLLSTPSNPLTYHPGPDEDYYIRFGLDVAQGQLGLTPDFIFMDPRFKKRGVYE